MEAIYSLWKDYASDIRRGIGGSELNNTLRSILTVQDDPDKDPAIRILRAAKMSLLGKEMTPVIIRQDENWELSFEDYEADDENAFDDFMPDDVPAKHPADPLTFLKTILQDGPLDKNRIENLAKEAGIKMNRLYRIREEAGVVIEKQGDKSSVWRLDSYIA